MAFSYSYIYVYVYILDCIAYVVDAEWDDHE